LEWGSEGNIYLGQLQKTEYQGDDPLIIKETKHRGKEKDCSNE